MILRQPAFEDPKRISRATGEDQTSSAAARCQWESDLTRGESASAGVTRGAGPPGLGQVDDDPIGPTKLDFDIDVM